MFGNGFDLSGFNINMASLTLGQQTLALIGAVVVSTGAGGGIALLVVDQSIDRKYATDTDVQIVRVAVEENQKRIEEIQHTQEETQDSVHELMLIVLDSEIAQLEKDIRDLEIKETLTAPERQYLAQLRRKLNDRQTQRQALYERMMIERR